MMIDLILSGQCRSYKKAWEWYNKSLFSNKDHTYRFFGHTWIDKNTENKLDDVVNTYSQNVSSCRINFSRFENPIKRREDVEKKFQDYSREFPAWNTYCMYYSMAEAFKCYDDFYVSGTITIRSRWDFALNLPVDEIVNLYSQFDRGKIFVPSDRMTPNHDFCADMFAFGSPVIMVNSYPSTLEMLKFHQNAGVPMIGEDMLAAKLKMSGLIGKHMVYVDMHNHFPPGKYNGNYHSIIRDDFTDFNQLRN